MSLQVTITDRVLDFGTLASDRMLFEDLGYWLFRQPYSSINISLTLLQYHVKLAALVVNKQGISRLILLVYLHSEIETRMMRSVIFLALCAGLLIVGELESYTLSIKDLSKFILRGIECNQYRSTENWTEPSHEQVAAEQLI